jgi:hypothetical protein
MKKTFRSAAALLGAAAVAAGSLFAASSASAAATPPWEPDPTSAGALTFYDATGAVITGGLITDAPFAAYVQGSATLRSDDTKATLFGYLPKNGVAIGAWSGEAVSTSTDYPNSSAPAPLKSSTKPVVTLTAADLSLADTLLADFPNTATDAYAGLYQVRLKTSGGTIPGASPTYDSADILISGNTWTQVYPDTGVAVTTTTALGVKPTKTANHGAKVTLTATVTPASAAGSVAFFDGAKLLGTKAVAAGKATYSTTAFKNGKHSLSAQFTPTDSTSYTASASGTRALTVVAATTTTKLSVKPGTKVARGTKLTFAAKVSPKAAAGTVKFFDGRKLLGKAKVKKGVAKFVTTLKKGKHKIKAQFVPGNTQAYQPSTSKLLAVTVKA